MLSTPKIFCYLTLLALLLAGCAPRLIAASPLKIASAPRPAPTLVNNSTRLSLEVDDVPSAAYQAIDLALRYGGWVIDRSCRGTGIYQVANLILGVPPSNGERLRRALTGLGQVYDQDAWDDTRGCSTCSDVSYIYLELSPRLPAWDDAAPPAPGRPNGGPAGTLRNAWLVTASIFTFLLNVLIWIVVVAGPFVLIGLGILALVRRFRR
jgi:hypothetical protein